MLIHSTRLGDVEVKEDNIIRFPYGLPGFLEEKEFAYLPVEEGNPFAFLQSSAEPNLTFVVVDPFSFFPDYEFAIQDELALEIGVKNENPPLVLNIVNIPDNKEEMTANLLAPVIINLEQRIAVQHVLEKTDYKTRHRLFPQGFLKQPGKGGK
jgi:flagellar assembly factor FliW